jgi:hypothetical protein
LFALAATSLFGAAFELGLTKIGIGVGQIEACSIGCTVIGLAVERFALRAMAAFLRTHRT